MNIVHIITGLNDGGAEATLSKLISHSPLLSPSYHVISLLDLGKYGQKFKEMGIPTYALNLNKPIYAFSALFKIFKILRSIQPDIVQTWLYHADLIGGIIARFAGVKQVYWGIRHSNLSPANMKITTLIVVKISALLSGFIPHKIISCSYEAVKSHIDIGYDKNKFVVINNGYDLSIFSKINIDIDDVKADFSIPTGIPLLGMVARFDLQKDHYNLLQSLASVKKEGVEFMCILVGNGITNDNMRLIQWINQLSLTSNVMLLGPRDDIPLIMNILDIHVLSSLGEAFPNVIAEAMACATPCITTDVGDASKIVGDTGWVVPSQDHCSLAQSIIEALTQVNDNYNWDLRKTASRKRIAEHYTTDKMVSDYYKVWGV